MKPDEFEFISRTVRQRSGLALTEDKTYLVESRLLPVARKYGYKSVDDFIGAMHRRPEEDKLHAITEAMTTNETLFFRDTRPFDQFKQIVLPVMSAARAARKQMRIWCAACSSGQEPYSLAMLLKEEAAQYPGWRFEIVATDLSGEMLERAKMGTYTQFEVQRGLPIQLLMKYFKQVEDKWQLSNDIKSMVTYREFNLLADPAGLGQFDVIFCRNVLIYFDTDTKGKVLGRLRNCLAEDGVLYLGGAETVLGVTDKFEPVPNERGLYRCIVKQGKNFTAP